MARATATFSVPGDPILHSVSGDVCTFPSFVGALPPEVAAGYQRVCALAHARLPATSTGTIKTVFRVLPSVEKFADSVLMALAWPFQSAGRVAAAASQLEDPKFWRRYFVQSLIKSAYVLDSHDQRHTAPVKSMAAHPLSVKLQLAVSKPHRAPAVGIHNVAASATTGGALAPASASATQAGSSARGSHVPRGITNDASRCYRNALIQIFSGVLNQLSLSKCGRLGKALKRFYAQLVLTHVTSPLSISNSSDSDMALLNAELMRVFPEGTPGTHHDPDELWQAMTEDLRATAGEGNPVRQAFEFSKNQRCQRTHLVMDGDVVSEDLSVGSGLCLCGAPLVTSVSSTTGKLEVSLPKLKAGEKITTAALIVNDMVPEAMGADAAIRCVAHPACDMVYLGQKSTELHSAPPFLLVQINRHRWAASGQQYNSTPVAVERTINVPIRDATGGLLDERMVEYDLHALTIYDRTKRHHVGVRCRRPPSTDVDLLDDGSVTVIPCPGDVLPDMLGCYNVGSGVQLLVYKRKGVHAAAPSSGSGALVPSGGAGAASSAPTSPDASRSDSDSEVEMWEDSAALPHDGPLTRPRLHVHAPVLTAPLLELRRPSTDSGVVVLGTDLPERAESEDDDEEIVDDDDKDRSRDCTAWIPHVNAAGAVVKNKLTLHAATPGSPTHGWHVEWLSASNNAAFLAPIMYAALRLQHPSISLVRATIGWLPFTSFVDLFRQQSTERGYTADSIVFTDRGTLYPSCASLRNFFVRHPAETGGRDVVAGGLLASSAVYGAAAAVREGLCRVYSVPNFGVAPFYVKSPGMKGFALTRAEAAAVQAWTLRSPAVRKDWDRHKASVIAWNMLDFVHWDDLMTAKGWLNTAMLSNGARLVNIQHKQLMGLCVARGEVAVHAATSSSDSPAAPQPAEAAKPLSNKGASQLRSSICLPPYFHEHLCGKETLTYKFDSACKIAKNWGLDLSVQSPDFILIIVNINNSHWYLVVIDVAGKALRVYNSLKRVGHSADHEALTFILRWYSDMTALAFGETGRVHTTREAGWVVELLDGVPQQNNSDDCGVFVYNFARCIMSGTEFDFDHADMPSLRLRLILDTLRDAGRVS